MRWICHLKLSLAQTNAAYGQWIRLQTFFHGGGHHRRVSLFEMMLNNIGQLDWWRWFAWWHPTTDVQDGLYRALCAHVWGHLRHSGLLEANDASILRLHEDWIFRTQTSKQVSNRQGHGIPNVVHR
jgi:hypothetical protein